MKTSHQSLAHTDTLTNRRQVSSKRSGSTYSAVSIQLDQVADQLGVTLKELAPLLQLSESTLHRLRRQTSINKHTAERVDLLSR